MNKIFDAVRLFRIAVLSCLFMSLSGMADANNFYAAYNGAQQGVTVRSLNLQQVSFFATPHPVNAVAAGPNNDLYVTYKNHIYNYTVSGALIKDMAFPDSGINYTDISVRGNRVYVSYNGSQKGVTIRDLALNQLFYFATPFSIKGIAAGTDNDIYLAAGNGLYRYGTNGILLKSMIFPDKGIDYTDVTITCGRLLASYSGSQRGVTIRDLTTLNQYSFFATSFDIAGLVAGTDNDVYVSSSNHLYNLTLTGIQKQAFTWPQTNLSYDDVNR